MSNREYAREKYKTCSKNLCGHFGERNDCRGCLLLEHPSRIWNRLLKGQGCIADPPLFEGIENEGTDSLTGNDPADTL